MTINLQYVNPLAHGKAFEILYFEASQGTQESVTLSSEVRDDLEVLAPNIPITSAPHWFGATGVILAISVLLRVLVPVMLGGRKG